MPAIYAHDRFGEAVIAHLPPSFSEILQKYPEALHLGFQGPDIMFYHKPITKNAPKQIGIDMHHTPAKVFFVEQAKRLIDENPDLNPSPFLSYIAGFLCHFLLDISLHPYIYEIQDTGIPHGRIESEFDKYLLKQDGIPYRGYNTADKYAVENGTAKACAYTLGVTEEEAARAIRTMKSINGYFTSKSEAFHTLAHIVLSVAGMNKKFGSMFRYKQDEPSCAKANPILAQQLEEAVPFAVKRIEEYFSNLSQIAQSGEMDEAFDKLYTGGLTNVKDR